MTTSSSNAILEHERKTQTEKREVIFMGVPPSSVSRPSMRLIYIPAHKLPPHKHALGHANCQIWTSSVISLHPPWINLGKSCFLFI